IYRATGCGDVSQARARSCRVKVGCAWPVVPRHSHPRHFGRDRMHARRLAVAGHRRPFLRLGLKEKNSHGDRVANPVLHLEHVAAGVRECFRGGTPGPGTIPCRAVAGRYRRHLRADTVLACEHRRATIAADDHSHPGRLQPRVPRHGSGPGQALRRIAGEPV
ncbi:uncharacterized protein METZ01_LOCUS400828, partial [marine metagenome]